MSHRTRRAAAASLATRAGVVSAWRGVGALRGTVRKHDRLDEAADAPAMQRARGQQRLEGLVPLLGALPFAEHLQHPLDPRGPVDQRGAEREPRRVERHPAVERGCEPLVHELGPRVVHVTQQLVGDRRRQRHREPEQALGAALREAVQQRRQRLDGDLAAMVERLRDWSDPDRPIEGFFAISGATSASVADQLDHTFLHETAEDL